MAICGFNSRNHDKKSENIVSLKFFDGKESMQQQQESTSTLTSAAAVQKGPEEPFFSRKKSLLTIGQYAVRQGISAGVVQECAKLGVVQVRKHRNKIFIVDLPFDMYKALKQQDSQSSEDVDASSSTDKITDLVNRIFQPVITVNEHNESDKLAQLSPAESSFIKSQYKVPDTTPDLQLFAIEQDQIETDSYPNEPAAEKFRVPLLRSISDSLTAFSVRRVFVIFLAAALAVSVYAYLWVNMNLKNQQEKLRQAYQSINKLSASYEDIKQKAQMYEVDMMNWQAEAQRAKSAMMSSEAELQDTRKSLSEARKDLENMRQYNTDAVNELNEKITKIRSGTSGAAAQTAE